jgi:hypothetical protein
MRRLLSIWLFAVIVLPLIAPLLSNGAAAESNLPACCRRNGKHHCMMSMAEAAVALSAQDGEHRFQAPPETCPYQQRAMTSSAHHEISAIRIAPSTATLGLQDPTALAQVECLRRISFDRSRQKRGPPSLLS